MTPSTAGGLVRDVDPISRFLTGTHYRHAFSLPCIIVPRPVCRYFLSLKRAAFVPVSGSVIMMSIVPAILTLSLVLSCFGLALAAANDTCYNKDGIEINTAFACGSTAAASQCCYWGWICLSNGLCSPGPDAVNNGLTNYYRPDGCTDPTWSSENCFSGCNNCM